MLALMLALTAPGPSSAAIGDWADGAKASARLIAAGVGDDGRLDAGIEVVLPPGWKTYWRSPGDAGIAPLFDFSASRNVVEPQVTFPLPHRFDDGYSVTNVYENRVVFPVSAFVPDRDKPVELHVVIDLGVCEEVCIPDRIEARLAVAADVTDAVAARALASARSGLPGRPEPGRFWVTGASRQGGSEKRPVFRVSAIAPDAEAAVVYIEGPPDWYPEVPRFAGVDEGRAAWTVQFSRLGARTPIAGARLRVTIVSGDRSIEQSVGLD